MQCEKKELELKQVKYNQSQEEKHQGATLLLEVGHKTEIEDIQSEKKELEVRHKKEINTKEELYKKGMKDCQKKTSLSKSN